MRNRLIAVIVAMVMLVCLTGVVTLAAGSFGWKSLFDGKTLNGWKPTGNPKSWIVEDGAIACLGQGGGYLATKDNHYDNFQLAMEFKVSQGANSGIFFHWTNLGDPVQTGIEVQILDSAGKETPDRHDCGAIYDCLAPKKNAMKPAGEWNQIVITCKDNLIGVQLNGERVIAMNVDRWTTAHQNWDGSGNKFDTAYKDMPRTGYIGLQDHGGKVWFRNIKVRML